MPRAKAGSEAENGKSAFDALDRSRIAAAGKGSPVSLLHQLRRAKARGEALQAQPRLAPIGIVGSDAHGVEMAGRAVQKRAAQFRDERLIIADRSGERSAESLFERHGARFIPEKLKSG